MSNRGSKVRDMVRQNDVTMMRSYLEVDVAEWLSENEIPFAYEGFVIPSVIGPGKDRWDETVEAIQAVGRGDRGSIELPTGEVMDAFDIRNEWDEIYQKHELMDEQISIPPRDSLAGFDKQLMLPDFALYLDADMKNADEGFDWGDYDYILEVSGLYGVGLPEESDESDWWDWYRVSAVAYKEFMYKMLGLWDDVVWVIPNQGGDDGGIPVELRNDDHYVVMNTTQSGLSLEELADHIGVTPEPTDSGLSPAITPTKYKRPLTSSGQHQRGQITPVEYDYGDVRRGYVDRNENAVDVGGGYIMFHGDLGEVYVGPDTVRVRESQWRGMNMIMLREYVLECLRELDEDGIVTGLREA